MFTFLERWLSRLLLHVVQPFSSHFASAEFQSFLLVQFGSYLKNSCLDYNLECFAPVWKLRDLFTSKRPPSGLVRTAIKECQEFSQKNVGRTIRGRRESFVFNRAPDTKKRFSEICEFMLASFKDLVVKKSVFLVQAKNGHCRLLEVVNQCTYEQRNHLSKPSYVTVFASWKV